VNPSASSSPNPNYMIPGAIVLAGIIIAGAIFYSNSSPTAKTSGTASGTPTPIQTPKPVTSKDHILGDPNAPVTLIEFGDFQCPFCGKFFKDTEPKLIDEYIKTGKVRFVYRDFAFLGLESVRSAEAAECANDQGKFWEFHNFLYNHQAGENQGGFADVKLKGFASELGLDTTAFNSCFDAEKYKDEVAQDLQGGRDAGVGATPSFFVDDQLIQGALPLAQFEQVINDELKKAGK